MKHVRGIVSMAHGDDPDSATTSFFIVLGPAPMLLIGQAVIFANRPKKVQVLVGNAAVYAVFLVAGSLLARLMRQGLHVPESSAWFACAVVALFPTNEQPGGACGRLVADAQELTEEQVLGVHRDVRLEVALPPALGVLLGEKEVGGALYGECGGVVHPGRHGGVDVGFAGRGNTGPHGPGASVGRRCHGFPFVQWHVSAVGPPSAGTRSFAAPAGDYARAIRPIVIISFVRRRSRRAP